MLRSFQKAVIIFLAFLIFSPLSAFSIEKTESPASKWFSELKAEAKVESGSSQYYAGNLLSVPLSGSKEEQGQTTSRYDEWPIKISPGIRGGNGRTLYYVDGFIPFIRGKSFLFFANPRVVFGSNDTQEANGGIGIRKLLFNDNMFLGINGYFDTQRSERNYRHNQFGAGAEAIITEWLDLRANGYFPVSGKRTLPDTTTYTFKERSFLSHQSRRFEEPLSGFDYEGGVLIPFISKLFETRAYVGGYHYNSKVVEDIDGIKGRVEVRPLPFITVNVEARDDNTFGSDVLVGGYISIPLSFKKEKSLLDVIKDSWKKRGPRSPRERMTDVVVRDIDVFTSDKNTTTVQQTKIYDMVYVDNRNNTGVEDGSLSHPYNTVTEGLSNLPDDYTLYIFEGSGNYTGNFTVANTGAVIWGEGYEAFPGAGGGGYPVLDGNSSGAVLTVNADDVEVMGLKLQNSGNTNNTYAGVNAADRSGGNIHHNIMDNNRFGIHVRGDGSMVSDWTVANNTLSTSLSGGIFIDSENSSTLSGFTISNNTITGSSGEGIYISGDNSMLSDFTISGNTITDNDRDGIRVGSFGTLSDFTISGNTILSNGGAGIGVNGLGGTLSDFTISGNTASDNGSSGIGITGGNSTFSDFTVSNNTLTGNGDNGIYVYSYESTFSDFTISGNTASDNLYGIEIDGIGSSTFTGFTVSNNTLTGNDRDGIYVYGIGSTFSDFTVLNNAITGSDEDGINIFGEDSTLSGFTISGNTITDNSDNGIEVRGVTSTTLSDFTISGNTITDNDDNGIEVFGVASTLSGFTISGNTITDNGSDGIEITAGGGSDLSDFTISGNTITDNGSDGILISAVFGAPVSDFTFSNNTITMNNRGIVFGSAGTPPGTFSNITFGQNSEGNSIFSNTTADFYENTTFSFTAEQNYWGGGAPTLSVGFDDVDFTPFLTTDPN